MPYEITIDHLDELREAFKQAPKEVDRFLQKATKDAGKLILQTEKNEVPIKTGQLRRSIVMDYAPISVSIYPTVNYAIGLNFGTKPHTILPRAKKVLRFKSGGGWVFATRVNHPGTKANPFVERTVTKSEGGVNKFFDTALDEIINFLAT